MWGRRKKPLHPENISSLQIRTLKSDFTTEGVAHLGPQTIVRASGPLESHTCCLCVVGADFSRQKSQGLSLCGSLLNHVTTNSAAYCHRDPFHRVLEVQCPKTRHVPSPSSPEDRLCSSSGPREGSLLSSRPFSGGPQWSLARVRGVTALCLHLHRVSSLCICSHSHRLSETPDTSSSAVPSRVWTQEGSLSRKIKNTRSLLYSGRELRTSQRLEIQERVLPCVLLHERGLPPQVSSQLGQAGGLGAQLGEPMATAKEWSALLACRSQTAAQPLEVVFLCSLAKF